MNLFVLDSNPTAAARALHNAHLRKMILETAQILDGGTRAILNDLYPGEDHRIVGIPKSQRDNPVILSARSGHVYEWALHYFQALLTEYRYRFAKSHSYDRQGMVSLFKERWYLIHRYFPSRKGFRLAMPTLYRGRLPDHVAIHEAVGPYRSYYANEKLWDRGGTPMLWTKTPPPYWLSTEAALAGFVRIVCVDQPTHDNLFWFERA